VFLSRDSSPSAASSIDFKIIKHAAATYSSLKMQYIAQTPATINEVVTSMGVKRVETRDCAINLPMGLP